MWLQETERPSSSCRPLMGSGGMGAKSFNVGNFICKNLARLCPLGADGRARPVQLMMIHKHRRYDDQ